MSDQGGFYKLLYDLITTDDSVKRYRKNLDSLRKQKELIRAKAEAELELLEQRIKAQGALEHRRVQLLTQRFLNLRRKELGVAPIKTEHPIAR